MQHVRLTINRSCAERDNIGNLHRSESNQVPYNNFTILSMGIERLPILGLLYSMLDSALLAL